ncbi:hypothetical protein OIU85_019016 [Salix viminalis]|uniref:Uncharacterized protein n=1 Tax=Salix viminalis TaxID=40686 RepID=A0A9Q0ZJL4_SALVM|nr:hypothetical protein OIU85_019016 [Salix viminalis]
MKSIFLILSVMKIMLSITCLRQVAREEREEIDANEREQNLDNRNENEGEEQNESDNDQYAAAATDYVQARIPAMHVDVNIPAKHAGMEGNELLTDDDNH